MESAGRKGGVQSGKGGASRFKVEPRRVLRYWPPLLAAAVVLACFLPLVTLKRVPFLSDIKTYYYPAWKYLAAFFPAKAPPFWCREIYGGFPLFADSETGLFYPLNHLFFLLPSTAGFNYSLVFHFLLAALFTYAYARRLGLTKISSLLAALSFSPAGFLLAHMIHPNVVYTAAWLPAFLYLLEGYARGGGILAGSACGGLLGLQFLSGFLMIPLMEVCLGFFYVLFHPGDGGKEGGRLRRTWGFLLAVLLGMGLGMVQNLPSYHLVQSSYRAGGLEAALSNVGNLPPAQLPGLVFPRLFGKGVGQAYAGAWTFEETYGYVGIVPLLLAPLALLRPRGRHALFFLATAATALLLSLGRQGLLWVLIQRLPGFNVLKGSSRFLLLFDFSIALLGAMGLDALRRNWSDDGWRAAVRRWWSRILLLLAASAGGFYLLYTLNPLRFRTFALGSLDFLFGGAKADAGAALASAARFLRPSNPEAWIPFGIAAVLIALLIPRGKHRMPLPLLSGVVTVLVIADVLLFSALIYRPVPREAAESVPEVVHFLEDAGPGRVALFKEPGVPRGEFPLSPNQLLPYGIEDAFGFSTIPPRRMDRYLALLDHRPSRRAAELAGIRHLCAPLYPAGDFLYQTGWMLEAGKEASFYDFSGRRGSSLVLLLQGPTDDRTTSGNLTITLYLQKTGGEKEVSLSLHKEGGEKKLEVSASGDTGDYELKTVILRTPGHGEGLKVLQVRLAPEGLENSSGVRLSLEGEGDLRDSRVAAVDLLAGEGEVTPLSPWTLVHLDERFAVYELPSPSPRAYVGHKIRWVESWQDAVDLSFREGDWSEEVILVRGEVPAGTEEIPSGQGPVEAVVKEEEGDRLSLEASTETGGILVINQDYLPGWEAEVDGRRVPLFSAYGMLTALRLPPGKHHVSLRYFPPGLLPGAVVSLLSLFLLFLLLALGAMRGRATDGGDGGRGSPPGAPGGEEGRDRPDESSLGKGDRGGGGESVSAFFPMYNDAASLPVIVDKARRVLSRLTDDYEIIIVNDGSTDGTAELAEEARSRHPCIKVVHHPRNLGYGAALRSGISASTKDWIFYTDGDGQYDVEELEALFALRRNADVVNGYKRGRADPWYRKALGRMYSFLVKRAFSLPVRDVDCDFRLMRGDLARSLDLHCDGGAICVELVKKLQLKGAVFREVAVSHYPRLDGNSKFFRPGNLVKMPLELVPLWCKLMAAGKEG